MRKKKKLVPLSQLLSDECLGDVAKFANFIYIDTNISSVKNQKPL